MKTLLTCIVILVFTEYGFSQQKTKNVFLAATISKQNYAPKASAEDVTYYTIDADKESPYATDIYSLADFTKKNAKAGATFYYNRNDSITTYYNYFRNISEALLFLSNTGWDLYTVSSQVSSDYSSPIGINLNIKTSTVYYLKKELK